MLVWALLARLLVADPDVLVLDSAPQPAAAPSAPWLEAPLFSAGVLSRVLLNPHFNNAQAELLQMWHVGSLRAELSAGTHVKAVAEAQVRWGAYAKMSHDSQWAGEVALREGYVLWHGDSWSASLGQRLIVWGKNEWGAPADVLSSVDLRYDPTALFVAPRNARVPTFVLTGSYSPGPWLRIEAVVQPFFTPNRFFYGGHDVAALIPDATDSALFAMALGSWGASARDSVQQGFVGTQTPGAAPTDASVALRVSSHVGDWDLAATAWYGWDRTPLFSVDPTTQYLLAATPAEVQASPQLYSLLLFQVLQSKTPPVTVTYQRMLQLALEAEVAVGDWMLRADAGFAPAQVYVTRTFSAVTAPTVRGVLSADTTAGDRFFFTVGTSVQAVNAPDRTAPLLAMESVGSKLPPWAVTWTWVAQTRANWPETHLDLRLAVLYEVLPGEGIAWAQFGYTPWENHTFALGGSYLAGLPTTLGDLYSVNSFAYVQYQGAW